MLGIVSIFTYELEAGKEKLEAANVASYSLSDYSALTEVAAEKGMIGQAETKNYKSGVKSSKRSLDHSVTRKTTAGNAVVFILLLKIQVKFHQYQRKSYYNLLNYLVLSASLYLLQTIESHKKQ